MYVIFAELEGADDAKSHTVQTLEQAFAQIAFRCGLSYRFVSHEGGWALEMTDVERPDCSPEPIHSSYKRPQDAQHDLMTQAVDGRIRGHIAINAATLAGARIVRAESGGRADVV